MIDKILTVKEYSDEDKQKCFKKLGFTPKNEYMVIFKNNKRIDKGMQLILNEVKKAVVVFDISVMRNKTVAWCGEVRDLR